MARIHLTPNRSRGELVLVPDAGGFARAGAERFAQLAEQTCRHDGRFTAVLTGGGSPVAMYRLLASGEFAERIPWHGVHLFWGDERCVPPDHHRSNFRMARNALIRKVPIPEENVHRMRGELGADRAAREYEAMLREFSVDGAPAFDLVHLGVGADGHVASLFPLDLPRLLEQARWVLPAMHRGIGEPRATLSVPAINAATRVEMLFPDVSKAEIARRVIEGPLDPLRIPAQLVRPVSGKLVWLVARDAARNLRAA